MFGQYVHARPGLVLQGDNFGLLLGWVDFVLVVALSAWKGGNLAELAELVDTMVEHPNQSQPNHVTNQSSANSLRPSQPICRCKQNPRLASPGVAVNLLALL